MQLQPYWSLPIFDLLPTRTPSSPPNLTPNGEALAQTLARPAGSASPNLPSAALRCIPAPQLRDAPTAILVFELRSEAAFGRFGVYNKQTVLAGQILGLCRRTAGLRQVRLRLYGWQPREFEGLVLYFRATEVYQQRVWNPRGAEIVDYLRPFDL